MAKQKKQPKQPSKEWLATYGDMITLMLCFFVMLFNPDEVDPMQMAALSASIKGDPTSGGQSLASGRLSDLGNTINMMPSIDKGESLGLAVKRAVSLFTPEIKSNKISIRNDERGLIITLLADTFFSKGSAELNLDLSRETLMKLSNFFLLPENIGKNFRIEGHTDNQSVENTNWPSLWELSTARAANVLHYLSDLGVDEKMFSITGFADKKPMFKSDSPESQAYNRRVDIIMLDDGHF